MTNKQRYYLAQFKKIDNGQFSWNWSAFFSFGIWCYYRKTYIGLAILIAADIVLFSIPQIVCGKLSEDALWFLFLTYATICGAFGNNWYYETIKRKIREGYHTDERYKPTSRWAVVLSLILTIWLSVITEGINPGYSENITNAVNEGVEIFADAIFICAMYFIEKRGIKKKKDKFYKITEESITKMI